MTAFKCVFHSIEGRKGFDCGNSSCRMCVCVCVEEILRRWWSEKALVDFSYILNDAKSSYFSFCCESVGCLIRGFMIAKITKFYTCKNVLKVIAGGADI